MGNSITENDVAEMNNEQRVSWFCRRYWEWPLKQAKNTIDREQGRNDFIAFLLIIFSVIRSLSIYRYGRYITEHIRVSKFMGEYFDKRWMTKVKNERFKEGDLRWYNKKEEITYADRFYMNYLKSMSDFLFIDGDAIDSEKQTSYFDYDPDRKEYKLGIHPDKLLEDFNEGVERYFGELENSDENSDIYQNFMEEFEYNFIKRVI